MKRKFLIVLLTVVSAVCLALGISACDSNSGSSNNGYSQNNNSSASSDEGGIVETDSGNASSSGGSGETGGSESGGTQTYEQRFVENGITYTLDSNVYSVTTADKSITEAEILSEYGGLSVTSIGIGAFSNCTALTSVVIPNSITSIGKQAFYECNSLASVTMGSGVKIIDEYAFMFCTALTSITLPNGITSLGYDAFYQCGLQNIIIPESVTSIGENAFYQCGSLTSATVSGGSIGKNAFSHCASLVTLTIGKNVTSIGDDAFSGCSSLAQINYNAVSAADLTAESDAFNGVGASAYDNRDYLTVNIGADVKTIPAYLFYAYSAPYIISVIFDENCKCESIGDYAFANCTNFTSITNMPATASYNANIIDGCTSFDTDSLAVISDGGKYLANELIDLVDDTVTYFIVKDGTTSIAANVFADCNSIRFVYIPESVTKIGSGALKFASVSSNCITEIFFESSSGRNSISTNYTNWLGTYTTGSYIYYSCVSPCEIDGDYIYKVSSDNAVIYAYYGTDTAVTVPSTLGGYPVSGVNGYAFAELAVTSVTLPSTCETVGGDVATVSNATYVPFGWCANLTTVTFAAQSVEIEAYSFYNCTALTSVDFGLAQVATIMNNAFDGCTSLQSITLPSMLILGQAIFNGCTALTSVTAGSETSVTITGYVSVNQDGSSYSYNYSASIAVNNGADLATALKQTYADYIMLYINFDLSAYANMNS